jgi:hypothetical protein
MSPNPVLIALNIRVSRFPAADPALVIIRGIDGAAGRARIIGDHLLIPVFETLVFQQCKRLVEFNTMRQLLLKLRKISAGKFVTFSAEADLFRFRATPERAGAAVRGKHIASASFAAGIFDTLVYCSADAFKALLVIMLRADIDRA